MFEIIGWATLRLYGWGWLWGKEDYRAFQKAGGADAAFGNGSGLLPIGFLSIIVHAVAVTLVLAVLGRI